MRIIAIMLITIISSSLAQSQISGIYSMNMTDKSIDCNIYLFEDFKYYLELSESITSDINESLVLSYGSYVVNDNQVVFTDQVHDFKMEMLINNKRLDVKQSFSFLLNKKFFYYSDNYYQTPKFIDVNIYSHTLQQERQDYMSNNNLIPFECGLYENEQGYQLYVNQLNNKYQLYFKGLIISDGTWSKIENELVLYDTELKSHFYVLVGNNILISKLLPGDYKGYVLQKQENF